MIKRFKNWIKKIARQIKEANEEAEAFYREHPELRPLDPFDQRRF